MASQIIIRKISPIYAAAPVLYTLPRVLSKAPPRYWEKSKSPRSRVSEIEGICLDVMKAYRTNAYSSYTDLL